MKMKTNTRMQRYLDAIQTEKKNNCNLDLSNVENIIFPEFLEWDGCVLLKHDRSGELPTRFTSNQFKPDKTAFEADYNHVHLNDFFDEEVHSDGILNIGIKILQVWAAVLYQQFKGLRQFDLILSLDGEEVVLRFYTVRENEVPWLDKAKLESYFDGLLLIEI